MSVASQDDKSRVASNAYFPDIPKILPHEKVCRVRAQGGESGEVRSMPAAFVNK